MKPEEILELVRAGYSKPEIEAMTSGEKPEPEHQPEKAPEPEKQPEPEKVPEQNSDMLKLLVNKFEELTGAIQANNILYSNNKQGEEKKPEELLAEIISPPRK